MIDPPKQVTGGIFSGHWWVGIKTTSILGYLRYDGTTCGQMQTSPDEADGGTYFSSEEAAKKAIEIYHELRQ